jgi:Putative endonuclease, protein of unknown function (DUF1780)
MTESDDRYLEELRADAADSRSLMSNPRKSERERMVVRALLRCLGVPFEDREIVAGEEEPIDVAFRAARFQIRDIVGDRKRNKEVAEREQLYRDAKNIADVMTPFTQSRAVPFDRAAEMVADALTEKSRRYGARVCSALDAVAYLDLGNSHLHPSEPKGAPDALAELRRQGWRSVSMLALPYGVVLAADAEAPDFLRARLGLALKEWPGPDGWFEADDD